MAAAGSIRPPDIAASRRFAKKSDCWKLNSDYSELTIAIRLPLSISHSL